MTVAELIEKLRTYPLDNRVCIETDYSYWADGLRPPEPEQYTDTMVLL